MKDADRSDMSTCSRTSSTRASRSGTRRSEPIKARYSKTVISGYRGTVSGRYPTRRRTSRDCSMTSNPATRAIPLVGGMYPARMRIVVVLPAPFGPRNPTISPGRALKLRSWMAGKRSVELGQAFDVDHRFPAQGDERHRVRGEQKAPRPAQVAGVCSQVPQGLEGHPRKTIQKARSACQASVQSLTERLAAPMRLTLTVPTCTIALIPPSSAKTTCVKEDPGRCKD